MPAMNDVISTFKETIPAEKWEALSNKDKIIQCIEYLVKNQSLPEKASDISLEKLIGKADWDKVSGLEKIALRKYITREFQNKAVKAFSNGGEVLEETTRVVKFTQTPPKPLIVNVGDGGVNVRLFKMQLID